MSAPLIRRYCDADYRQLESIYNRCKPLELIGEPIDYQLEPLAEDQQRRQIIFSSDIWLYCAQDKVLGFVTIRQQQIGWLYVDPDAHRQGIGQKLLQFIIDNYPGELVLNIVPSNTSAASLYQKFGFQKSNQITIPIQGNDLSVHQLKRPA